MRTNTRLALSATAAVLLGLATAAQAKAVVMVGPQTPSTRVAASDVVVVGKVTEIEADQVEAAAYPGAPKDQRMSFKVAVVKADEALMGGAGLTRFRVGFPSDAPPAAEPPSAGKPGAPGGPVPIGGRRGPPMVVALTAGMEGCFFLARHHDGDFYVLANCPPLLKKAENYEKELAEVKKVAKAVNDPVAALKSKDLETRFLAAYVVLQRYQTAPRPLKPGAPPAREPIPEEENKLIVALLKELPWITADHTSPGPGFDPKPTRSALWYLTTPSESGFKDPVFPAQGPGDPPVDYGKIMDEATTKFLKESGDKIRIKRFVQK